MFIEKRAKEEPVLGSSGYVEIEEPVRNRTTLRNKRYFRRVSATSRDVKINMFKREGTTPIKNYVWDPRTGQKPGNRFTLVL